MDSDRKKSAKKYEKIKLATGISEGLLSMIILFLFVISGYSHRLEIFVNSYTAHPYLAFLLFLGIISIISEILSFPLDYFFGFRLEHKFGLSNQTFFKWIIEGLKSIGIAIVLGVPILILFFWMLRNFEFWWFWFGCLMLLYSVILAQIAPVLIFPLFYKFKPLENESLIHRILNLCEKVGFKVKGVYSFDLSKSTKKANAAFTGLGKTKRIILADTLLSGFSEDEIEVVFAHELGHYKKGHIKKNIIFSTLSTFFGLFVISFIYQKLIGYYNFSQIYQLGALPLLVLISGILGFLTRPLSSFISRKFEYEADKFAITTTQDFNSFKSTMEKLASQNLTDDEPNKLVEFWFHSHPSIKRRIAAAEKEYESLSLRPAVK